MKLMMNKTNKISNKIAILLFLVFFLVGLFTFKDYGAWVDEEFQRSSGLHWLNYILNFLPFENFKNEVILAISQPASSFTLPSVELNRFYSMLFDLPAAFLEIAFNIQDPKNYYHLRHFLNFLFFFIASIFFFKLLLNRFSNVYTSIIGTLFFVLSPRIYGSSFYNNKDILFLTFLTVALYFCFKVFDKFNSKNLLVFFFFAALLTCSRILGIFLPIFFLIFYVFSVLSKKRNLDKFLLIFICCVFYFLVIIAFWPALWEDPINNFVLGWEYFSNFNLNVKMLFAGEYVSLYFLPNYYIFTWIFITTPVLYTLLFIFGYYKVFSRFFLRFINIKENKVYDDFWRSNNEKKDLFILFNITAIVLFLITFNVPIYNGWRHIYFLNIFIIYLSTVGFYQLGIYLKRNYKKSFHYHISIIFLITVIYKMMIYHPFQSIYFNNYLNEISHLNFEIDHGGLSGKRSLEKILSLEKNKKTINIGVASWLPLERSAYLLDSSERKRIEVVGRNYQEADYLFTNFISEVDKKFNKKYKIPSNFTKIDEFFLDGIKVYEIYKKN